MTKNLAKNNSKTDQQTMAVGTGWQTPPRPREPDAVDDELHRLVMAVRSLSDLRRLTASVDDVAQSIRRLAREAQRLTPPQRAQMARHVRGGLSLPDALVIADLLGTDEDR